MFNIFTGVYTAGWIINCLQMFTIELSNADIIASKPHSLGLSIKFNSHLFSPDIDFLNDITEFCNFLGSELKLSKFILSEF